MTSLYKNVTKSHDRYFENIPLILYWLFHDCMKGISCYFGKWKIVYEIKAHLWKAFGDVSVSFCCACTVNLDLHVLDILLVWPMCSDISSDPIQQTIIESALLYKRQRLTSIDDKLADIYTQRPIVAPRQHASVVSQSSTSFNFSF